MNIKYILFILLGIVTIACKKEKHKIKTEPVQEMNISSTFDNKEKINLSTIASDIEYISLETNENSILDGIEDPIKNV